MSNKTYWQKTKGTKNFMKIVWKRLEVMIKTMYPYLVSEVDGKMVRLRLCQHI